jgi:signal transduction histidine kinase/DNA-binding NarL/FixJ family response regulator
MAASFCAKIADEKPWLLIFVLWTILIAGLAWRDDRSSKDDVMALTAMVAETAIDRDILYRRWAAGHGGVYVPVDEKTPPNPYLAANPKRDVVLPDGTRLTLVNPAYMTRQVYELAKEEGGVYGHLTSINPIRPANSPDPWETTALQSFEEGRVTATTVASINNEPYLRMMKVLPLKAPCLPCHGGLGAKVGQVRGGISVSVPFTPIAAILESSFARHFVQSTLIWLPAIGGLFWVRQRYRRQLADTVKAREEKAIAEKRMAQAQKLEALGILAGGVAHDFNNILTIVTGYTEIVLCDAPAHSLDRDNLTMVLEACKRARDLVRSLMAFSRQQEEDGLAVSFASTVKEFVKMLRPTLPTTIEIAASVSEVGVIRTGRTDLQQVLMNLCTNAYQAMRDSTGKITIALDQVGLPEADPERAHAVAPGDYARLEVRDTGMGMDVQTQESIFDPFFTTKPLGEGTGLGLSIVYGIVQKLNGAIFVQSVAGEGTCFTIYLPLQGDDAEAVALESGVPAGGAERILVVDDEQLIAEVLRQTLIQLGYEVVAAYSGEQALNMLAESDFDLLMTDQTMPGMTGLELIRRVAGVKGLKTILITGYSLRIDECEVLGAEADGFMRKPFERAGLAQVVRNALDGTQDASSRLEARVSEDMRLAMPDCGTAVTAQEACAA